MKSVSLGFILLAVSLISINVHACNHPNWLSIHEYTGEDGAKYKVYVCSEFNCNDTKTEKE